MQNSASNHGGRSGWLGSTVGRKQLIALTGLGLSSFVLVHMLGNLLIFAGPQAYNEYSHKLTSNPLIYAAEAGLVAMFFGHLIFALYLSWQNRQARDTRYAMLASGPKRTTWTQRSLWAQGLLILVFIILHLITFKYGPEYVANYGQGEIRDLHRLVLEIFRDPLYVVGYVLALIVLGFHLSHGVGSSLQTLGLHHPRYQKYFAGLSLGYALLVSIGFISQPIYVYIIHRGQ